MNAIPTQRAWLIIGRNSEGDVNHMERAATLEEAELKQAELSVAGDHVDFTIDEFDAVIPDRTLPTTEQQKELCVLMQQAFVAIRSLGYSKRIEPMVALADVFHNLPVEMYDQASWDWHGLRRSLETLQEKYPGELVYPFAELLREIQES